MRVSVIPFLLFGAFGCASTPDVGPVTPTTFPASRAAATAATDAATFVARLGDDTVAVEEVRRTSDSLWATIVLRSPETTLTTHAVALNPAGLPTSLMITRYRPDDGDRSDPIERTEMEFATPAIPFIDMVHWPFLLMAEQTAAASTDTLTLSLVAGQRTVPFRMEELGDGRYRATHPTRGPTTIETDARGRVTTLDATRTTRAMIVTRQPHTPVAPLAAAFASRPLGELSGRGEAEATVAGADITVDYGVPLKRGRDIFGALVPWERVWRTGANRATHFSTTRPLRFGPTVLPAGAYTLFTIPRPDRWTLLVNGRTDINGQAYDESADVARLDMRVRTLDQVVEPFTIVVEPAGGNEGVLRLRWDRTEAYLPFEVQ